MPAHLVAAPSRSHRIEKEKSAGGRLVDLSPRTELHAAGRGMASGTFVPIA